MLEIRCKTIKHCVLYCVNAAEKDQEINAINQSIGNQKGIGSQSKWYKECNTTNIDNKKCTCPNCHKKLDTLATLQAKSAKELARLNNTVSQSKSLIIKFHSYTYEQKNSHFERISITQRLEPDNNVIVPEMHVPDPLECNSNSINNIKKVLEYIQSITRINQEARKWLPVTCDDIPYNLVQKIKNNFLWLILIPGALHEEINMLKAFDNRYQAIRYSSRIQN
ncbi:19922_t:CDS:2 [Racocetra persica]|uniref:19922_t:CDS:1 n=1 Tax=Racocetra persica TaxID=160502 RepID=A0ACA9KAG6_9GLOM|nr:19922_t:CDS:2 [Racocetra persica]